MLTSNHVLQNVAEFVCQKFWAPYFVSSQMHFDIIYLYLMVFSDSKQAFGHVDMATLKKRGTLKE